MKKILLLLVNGLLITCLSGSSLADPFTPQLYTVSGNLYTGQIQLYPGETIQVKLGGYDFINTDTDFDYYAHVLNASNGGNTGQLTFSLPSGSFHPTGSKLSSVPFIDTNNIGISLASSAPIGATYNIEIGAKLPDGQGGYLETGVLTTQDASNPEFPTVALPIGAMLGLLFFIGRKRGDI